MKITAKELYEELNSSDTKNYTVIKARVHDKETDTWDEYP